MKRLLAILGATMISVSAWAHHSGAMFDRTKVITLSGTVKQYQFTNPHVWLILVATGSDGADQTWSIEGGSAGRMRDFGMVPSILSPGTKVKITAHPLLDGRLGGSFMSLTLPDGKVLTTEEPGRPDSRPNN